MRNPLALILLLSSLSHAQSPALAERAAQNTENLRVVQKAGLVVGDMFPQGWTHEHIFSLGVAIRAASQALQEHRQKYPNPVSDAYGSGTLTNIDESVKAGIRGITGDEQAKRANYQRGCVATRQAVNGGLVKVSKQTKGLIIRNLYLGCGLEHHATVLYPDGLDWEKAGVVIDGWLGQSAEIDKIVWPIASWKRRFPLHRAICSTNLED